ncbi:MAG: sulfurtransferase [Haliscomenobacter sp.]|uniref:sulfurtransferase n=1 Tax=Haliscomenobacter sp. TaxID=2717303 RepID=UPI00299FA572|nr:sulfurtransferase [Haliscomenobacter sp.]MDX2070182.1 sulfurtransferase [Haliscomenobacter sp.]
MKPKQTPLIQATELLQLASSPNLVLIDATNGKNAHENYTQKHLAGALFVDLDTQLADIKADVSQGGRHPLPTLAQFSETLVKLGISPQSHVVVYDDKSGANAAARFWWMLLAIGHSRVQVLDGGIQAAERAGFPMSAALEQPKECLPYPIHGWQLPQADMAEVEQVAQDPNYLVVDVRDHDRYLGLVEPIDLIAGHIHGAINIPFSENLDVNGLFKSSAELKAMYQEAFAERPADHLIVHCGSGVTACHTLLAVVQAGLEMPKLYVGSWSEWSRNKC